MGLCNNEAIFLYVNFGDFCLLRANDCLLVSLKYLNDDLRGADIVEVKFALVTDFFHRNIPGIYRAAK